LAAGSLAHGQSFNIDLDVFFGSQVIGNGAPSSSFGGAADQQGLWNRIPSVNGGPPVPLLDLMGSGTGATILKTASSPGGAGGFNFPGNTGDFALLLNDAEQVATLVSGGNLTYTFSGLASGAYDVYTYVAHIAGVFSATPVFVPEAVASNTQIVTGPMPGNAFQYLITHSIHRVVLQQGGQFNVSITQPPNHPQGMNVNGLQIVLVPEPSSALGIALGAAIVLLRKSKLGTAEREKMKHFNRTATAFFALLFSCWMTRSAHGQSFNIDIDIFFGDPGLGNGAPSASFGAAAGQQGFWNRCAYVGDPQSLSDLDGNATGVQMSYTTGKAGSGGGHASSVTGNTGDYALLLNDSVSVAPLLDGGHLTYLFSGLQAGQYRVYTYAVNIGGGFMPTPVEVFGGTPPVEIVTGPMPVNSFQHLITHSIHDVNVFPSGELNLRIVQPPNSPFSMQINGFQIVTVPEVSSRIVVGFGAAIVLLRRAKTGHQFGVVSTLRDCLRD
jgi:hypothetical protein